MNNNIKLRKIKSYGSIKRRKPLRLFNNRKGRRISKNIRSISDSFVNYSNINGKIVTYSYSSNSSRSSSSSSSSYSSSSYYESRYRKFNGGYKSHNNIEIALASQIQSLNRERSKNRKRKRREEYRYQDEEEEEGGEYDSEYDSEINSRGKRRRLAGAGGYSTGEVQRRSHSRRHSGKNKDQPGKGVATDTATPSLFTVASVLSFLAGVSLSLYNKYSN